jgi:hypothetical protein
MLNEPLESQSNCSLTHTGRKLVLKSRACRNSSGQSAWAQAGVLRRSNCPQPVSHPRRLHRQQCPCISDPRGGGHLGVCHAVPVVDAPHVLHEDLEKPAGASRDDHGRGIASIDGAKEGAREKYLRVNELQKYFT